MSKETAKDFVREKYPKAWANKASITGRFLFTGKITKWYIYNGRNQESDCIGEGATEFQAWKNAKENVEKQNKAIVRKGTSKTNPS